MWYVINNKTTKKTTYMAFDLDSLAKTKFERPTFNYPVPFFEEFFTDEKEERVFILKGLTAFELNTAQNAEERIKTNMNLIETVGENFGGSKEDIRKLVAGLLGKNESDVKENGFTSRMKETIQFGIAYPEKVELTHVNRMVEKAPVQMMELFYKIVELTAMVGEAAKKKPKDSGKVTK